MGFGILFLGYVGAFFLSLVPAPYCFLVKIAGFLLILIALMKIREYIGRFSYMFPPTALLVLSNIYFLVVESLKYLSITPPAFLSRIFGVVEWIEFFLTLLFHTALTAVVYKTAAELETDKIKSLSVTNGTVFAVFFALNLLGKSIFSQSPLYIRYFALPTYVMQLFWIVSNSVLIYMCYMYICPEGDEDMPRKKTNIQFVDRMLEEKDRRMEIALKEAAELREKRKNERKKKRK